MAIKRYFANADNTITNAFQENLSIRGGYNLPSLNFTAEDLYNKIREKIPNFECDFSPDHRQEYADSWPDETDGTLAEQEWGFKLEHNLEAICDIMIDSLRD